MHAERPTEAHSRKLSERRSERGRLPSLVAGGALLGFGLRRRSLGGTVAALAGGWLLYRGLGGGDAPDQQMAASSVADDDSSEAATAGAADVRRSVTIGRPADELYERWRDPETMTRIVGGFADVMAPSEDRWHWTVTAPLGFSVTWDTEFVEDRPGEFLRWTSTADAAVSNEGSVHFRPAPDDRGTEVTFQFRIDSPGGAVGDAVAARLGIVPDALAGVALDRFKSLVETGEIPTLEKNPSARGQGDRL